MPVQRVTEESARLSQKCNGMLHGLAVLALVMPCVAWSVLPETPKKPTHTAPPAAAAPEKPSENSKAVAKRVQLVWEVSAPQAAGDASSKLTRSAKEAVLPATVDAEVESGFVNALVSADIPLASLPRATSPLMQPASGGMSAVTHVLQVSRCETSARLCSRDFKSR